VQRVRIRKSHPALYRALMVLGFMGLSLAVNFWFSKPTFNPYGWPKELIGTIFFVLGASQIVFLNVFRDLRMVRIALAVSISFMFFWGASNAQQFFAGKASLQLPILFITVSLLQIPLLLESPVNPMTEKK
jgi:hypothetical protein